MHFSFKSSTFKYLIPREHGAWAMWVAPLILGIIFSGITLNAIVFLIAALLLFMAYSPLSMLMKSSRNRDEYLQAVVIAGLLFCIPGVYLALSCFSPLLLILGIVCFVLLGIHLGTQRFRKNMTLPVHMLGIIGLTMTAPIVYLLNTGNFDSTAGWLWAINFFYFSTTTFYIRLRIRIQSRLSGFVTIAEKLRMGAPAILSALLPTGIFIIAGRPDLAIPFIPGILKAFWGSVFFQPGKKSKPVVLGVTEIVFTLVFMALTVLVWTK
ncbi:MAG: YwiC-like family protein [Candidatus Marinimicrobia bacterium]|nr:YwiC-like family protein [Candidatus Neomarinimicrobiota bacterium]